MTAFCAERGIAPSVFLGRVVGPDEPAWLEADQDEVLAYLREKAKVCPSCGTRDEDWRDDQGKEINPPPFLAVARRDFGCQELETLRATIPDGERGVHVHLVPAGSADAETGER